MRSAVARLDRARLPKNGLYAEPCRWGNTPGLAVVGARVGALDKHGAQHLDAGPGAPGAAFAGALVVAGTQAGPGGAALGVAEHARVGSDLAQDGAGRRVVDAGDGLQQAERLGVGRERLVEVPVELLRAPAEGGVFARQVRRAGCEPSRVVPSLGRRRVDRVGADVGGARPGCRYCQAGRPSRRGCAGRSCRGCRSATLRCGRRGGRSPSAPGCAGRTASAEWPLRDRRSRSCSGGTKLARPDTNWRTSARWRLSSISVFRAAQLLNSGRRNREFHASGWSRAAWP